MTCQAKRPRAPYKSDSPTVPYSAVSIRDSIKTNMEANLPGQDDDDEGWISNFALDFPTDQTRHFVQSETTDLSMSFDAEGGAALPSNTTLYAYLRGNDNFDLMDTAFLDYLLSTENHTEDRPL
ncbi:hypothetical protein N7489_003272 [Penicillium chrysogenum]|jgi:hypothetical protein|uniref:Uncharacterized protein n=1 Tax=Penicillium chrysogenum TaxID=5076 RepID=A0ABQ8W850_PENCH|nr:uncharacterized protein N7489_003272 [Penicillium chrysogenum]KAJ5252862.1 hypothetical protein N7489_003272 [Penicillium chrysogenum]KAJ5253986.1 hypothetical protein N7524_011166 [Penicillium chrysogenum]KAJ5260094.1 hypothetical protein N7505_009475 [Penicillium chrysogenum]KAJ6141988.1 hypothetical protein N7497_011087 [Penicillium chrysogenum]